MKVLLSWLREYVDIDVSPEELAEKLALSGTEVESVDYLGKDINGVVVGEIEEITPHPQTDKLSLCKVRTKEGVFSVVCGAPNIEVKQKVPLALPDATIAGGVKVYKKPILGVISEGMILSEEELGLGEDASGILPLPPGTPLDANVKDILGLNDYLFQFEITPNRPDCLGIIGIAREIAVILGRELKVPTFKIEEEEETSSSQVKIEIEDADLCPRYVGKVVKDVDVHASPLWLRWRLKSAGIRSINNVVDVTNYVMLETGQPLHAFDFELIGGGKIIVRRAKGGEKLVTLDGVERELDEEMLVIADESVPVALAGVMGGRESEVSSSTKVVLIESANFKPVSISRTSRKLGLITEASLRFERGVDPNGALFAAQRAAFFIQNLAKGKVLRGEVDVYPRKIAPRKLLLREEKVNQVLGTELKKKEMRDILKKLQLKVSLRDRGLLVHVPTFRVDLEREIDLVEEIARIYGYNEIKPTLPGGRGRVGALNFEQKVEKKVKETLVASGLYEVLNYSMINPQFFEEANLPENHPWRKGVYLVNPLAADQSMLRTTLLPSLISTLSLNKSRGERSAHIFEVGRVFRKGKGNVPEEFKRVGIALMGSWCEKVWYSKEERVDIYDLKGIVENVMHSLRIDDWEIEESENPLFYPARFGLIKIFQDEVGFLGELHPLIKEKFDFEEDVFLAELSLDKLLKYAQFGWVYKEIPQFPGIPFDISLLVDVEVKAKEVEKVIKENGGPFLHRVEIFDVYTGKNIPKGKKSLAFSLLFLSPERTLREEEISESVEKIIEALEKELSAQVRRKVG